MQNKNTMRKKTIKVLFFGDIVGRAARLAVISYLQKLKAEKKSPDFVIANVENASHGFGLTEKNYKDLTEGGIDCLTSGNHIWDKKEIFDYIESADKLIRPINYPKGTLGQGSKVFDCGKEKIGVINALGRVFMSPIDSPWEILSNEIEKIKEITPNIIIDFHAEATAEKLCLGRYLSKQGVTALIGTHTHVQTADEQIINDMGYITDVGFCGDNQGIIGMDYETSLKRFVNCMPERYDVAQGGDTVINAVELHIYDGKTTEIKRLNLIVNNEKKETEAYCENNCNGS